jgi:Undecaprenyl-phosphate glucose phosphotransferase
VEGGVEFGSIARAAMRMSRRTPKKLCVPSQLTTKYLGFSCLCVSLSENRFCGAQMSVDCELEARTVIDRGPAATLRCEVVPYLLAASDAVTIILSGLAAASFYHWASANPSPGIVNYFLLGLLASGIYCLRFKGGGNYEFESASKPGVEIVAVMISWLTTVLVLTFLAFLAKISVSVSRASFLIFMGIAPIALLAMRKFEKYVLEGAIERGAIGRRNVVLVGDHFEIAALDERDLLALFGAGNVTRFTLTDAKELGSQQSGDIATFKAISHFVRDSDASEILLAVPWQDTTRIEFLREQMKLLPVWSRLLPDTRVRTLSNYTSSARQKVISIVIQRAPLRASGLALKRAVDLVFGLVALILLSPVIALAAIAIQLEGSGPIIFRQYRKGFNGRQFVMFKFRSMRVQENGQNGEAVTQATRNDPRVTRVGALLRASSIDELPQILNVIRGEMSLIGPRPHAIAHDDHFEQVLEDYAFRHHVKPGITGWAQVHGLRGATPTIDLISRRVKMDLWYINNWSLWLDVQIILKTMFEVLRKRNAY